MVRTRNQPPLRASRRRKNRLAGVRGRNYRLPDCAADGAIVDSTVAIEEQPRAISESQVHNWMVVCPTFTTMLDLVVCHGRACTSRTGRENDAAPRWRWLRRIGIGREKGSRMPPEALESEPRAVGVAATRRAYNGAEERMPPAAAPKRHASGPAL